MASSRQLEAAKLNVWAARRGRRAGVLAGKDARRVSGVREPADPRRRPR
jgi:hypothetical protein